MTLQAAIRLLYPPQCLTCGVLVETEFAFCGTCWAQTPFLSGLVCDKCGAPLPGEDTEEEGVLCDDCLTRPKPWARGRAVLGYEGKARKLILALKHGDRTDLARPASAWMARAVRPLVSAQTLVAPVPLHWWRLVARRYNQAALLSRGVACALGLEHCPDLLVRPRATPRLEGKTREERAALMAGSLRSHPKRGLRMAGRPVLLVDDVMTTGATLAAATEACLAGGAARVDTVALARVAPDT